MDFDKFGKQLKSNPRKTLRFVAGFSVTLIVLWLLVLMQTNSWKNESYVDLQNLEKISEKSGLQMEKEPEAESILPDPEKRSSAPGYGTVIFLLFAVGSAYYFLNKKSKKTLHDKPSANIELLESIPVSAGNNLVVAGVNDEYWIMSSGESGLEILKVFNRSEWKQRDKMRGTDPVKKTLFAELLNGFQKNGDAINGKAGITNEN
jgi:flagellar biogenesis protein FliO